MKRNNGYYWILENGYIPEIKRWVIGYWDGNSFWYDGDEYSESEFIDIDETQIVRS